MLQKQVRFWYIFCHLPRVFQASRVPKQTILSACRRQVSKRPSARHGAHGAHGAHGIQGSQHKIY